MGILEVTFFVNAAGLFFLSALIEKNIQKVKYIQANEVTTLKMPPAFIEGFESFVLFSLIIIFPNYQQTLYISFSFGVIITIL
jgi:hypothetical protein